MSKGRVFIVQEPLTRNRTTGELERMFDFSDASLYGRLELLLQYGRVALSPAPMITTLRKKLRDFNDDDYIVPVGDPTAIAAAATIAANNNRGQIKFLKWDSRSRTYTAIEMSLYGGSND